MAQGKHLYPFRTQKLSLVAVTILGGYPWENSTVPFYRTKTPKRGLFLCVRAIFPGPERKRGPREVIIKQPTNNMYVVYNLTIF